MEKKCNFKKLLTPKIITAFAGILLLLIITGILTGIMLSRKKDDSPAVDTAGIGVKVVLPDTRVMVLSHYKCGHIKMHKTQEYIGYTEEMLSQIPNCTPLKMTNEEVILMMTVDLYCDSHYILKSDDDGFLFIYSTDTERVKAPIRLNINASALPYDEYSSLMQGIVFDSLEEINIYLEGIDT